MKLVVVAGFLGSGKTTLLLALAHELVADGHKVAVIENEIGEVGIDADVVAAEGLPVTELFGGCICCTLATGVVDALETLARTYGPEYVLLEPTGIAQPQELTEVVGRYAAAVEAVRVVTLIDAERFPVLVEVVGPMLEGQVARADVIAVTKADLVSDADLAAVEAGLRGMGAEAPMVAVSTVAAETLARVFEVLT